jgi:hypothetical protein
VAKFNVELRETVTRLTTCVIALTKKEVVDHFELSGEEANEWEEHAQAYCEECWDEIGHRAGQREVDGSSEEVESSEVESVELEGE